MNKTFYLLKQTFKGKTIRRVLLNWQVKQRQNQIRGQVLDLASGSKPGYYDFLNFKHLILTRADYNRQLKPDIIVDLNQPINLPNNQFDVILFFNSLYILESPDLVIKECYRLLKPNGFLFLSSPFIFNETPEPHDYYRFTSEKLHLLLTQANFDQITITPIGNRFSAAAQILNPLFVFKPIKFIAYLVSLNLDKLVPERFNNCPLDYFCQARKPEL